jgi:PAS domain S-box-containing protein
VKQEIEKDFTGVRADMAVLQDAITENLFVAEKNISVIRIIVIACSTLAFFLMPGELVITPLADILLVLIWIYGLGTYFGEPYRKYPILRASWFTYISDGSFTTLWLYATGGVNSPFYLILCVSIIAVAYRFSLRVAMLTAALYVLAYVGLIFFMGQWDAAYKAQLMERISFFFIFGFFTNLITSETINQAKAKLQMKYIAEKASVSESSLRNLYNTLEHKYGQRAQELEESINRFESLIEAIPQMAWTSDPEGNVLYFNRAWNNFTGISDFKDSDWKSYICPEDVPLTTEKWNHSLATGDFFEIEYRWIRRDGEARWMLGRANPICNSKGEIELWIGTATDIHEQKQTEEKFKFLSDLMPQLVWTTDAAGYHNYFNQRWIDYTGYTLEQSQGTEMWNNLLHPDDAARSRMIWTHSLNTGELYEIEYRFKSKEGIYRWFLGRAMPLRNKEGKITQWFGTCTDIHDQKSKEAALRLLSEINESTRHLLDPVEIMAIITRIVCQHLLASRCAYAEVEADQETFTIMQDWTINVPTTVGTYPLSAFGPLAVKNLRSGKTLVINDVDAELSPEEGADTFNSIQVKAIICCPLIKQGKLAAMMAVHQTEKRTWSAGEIELMEIVVDRCWSIIERARSETQLREFNEALENKVLERTKELAASEERFRLIAENASDVIARATPNGDYLYISPSLKMLLGFEPEELIGKNRTLLIHPDDAYMLQENAQSNDPANDIKTFTFRVQHKDGHYIFMEVVMRKIRDPQTNEVIEIHSAGRDVTLRKEVEENLIRNNQELEQFAYVASHDMKEPLRMIASYSQLLLREMKPANENTSAYAQYIFEGVNRMKELISDLLDYSRVGRMDSKFALVDLNRTFNSVYGSLGLLIEETGAEINHEPLPTVMVIPSLINQLFQNLLENAIKFRKPDAKPYIEVTAAEMEKEYLFSVKDNGIGIDPKYADKVFVIFQRLHSREKYAGTGIGLAVCKKIVEFHGGKIWFESAPGEGTTFYFTLPHSQY